VRAADPVTDAVAVAGTGSGADTATGTATDTDTDTVTVTVDQKRSRSLWWRHGSGAWHLEGARHRVRSIAGPWSDWRVTDSGTGSGSGSGTGADSATVTDPSLR
jgi:hypothetical protein